MPTRIALTHRTTYTYDRAVALGPQTVRLRPAPHCRTPVHRYSLHIEPAGHFLNWQQDPFGNYLARIVHTEPVTKFTVCVDVVADLVAFNPFDFFVEPEADQVPFRYDSLLAEDLKPYLRVRSWGERFDDLLEAVPKESMQSVDFLVAVNRLVQERVGYVIRLEPGVQTPEETLRLGTGSCRDSAWLLVQLLRRVGLAARFVSGYLVQLVPDEKPLEGPAGTTKDFTDLHAWCEAFVPGAGWIGLDPTSGLLASEGHLPLCCTPEPQSAAPIDGKIGVCEVSFEVEMTVQRLTDPPRATRPMSDAAWGRLLVAGDKVDRRLRDADLRLTMGGEPTFIGDGNLDAEEWNTAALGEDKLRRGESLVRRLRRLWAPGAALHHGTGKWYPGEPLPRWAISCYWRPDGEPVWHDESLIADSHEPRQDGPDQAAALMQAIAGQLGVNADHAMPGIEDTWHQLWRERRLPVNVDPLASKLEDPLERARLARIWRQGLHATVGHALPLSYEHGAFISGPWFLREEHLFLLPGDSPMGFRLPLDSLPWVAEGDRHADPQTDPMGPPQPLPSRSSLSTRLQRRGREVGTAPPRLGESAAGLVRTALCVEPRDGILRVFLPPLPTLEAWLQLVAAIETSCAELALPVQLEGYRPPEEHRLRVLRMTPDPGVLEVNVPPVANWKEAVRQNDELYEAARQERLLSFKFEYDGRPVGSGGGNHVVLGGATPADSPFLRRPHLLPSMVAFWNNHPSLTYLFCGQFIGPTSQAPRIDEARQDTVAEFELAYRRLLDREHGSGTSPWLIDRALRHLLIDLTGNTHRSEFCIDKLFSPDSASGRLGLLELRSFEMPPHPRMALAQQLLVRACVAAFADQAYDTRMVRWGTAIHDRWALPRFLEEDFRDVLRELAARGLGLEEAWYRANIDFRFPVLGRLAADGVDLELRSAIEPWHVLGEEVASGGNARYVDSSLERVQVLVRNLIPGRHEIAVNGRRLPLHPTGTVGEAVAGLRYRAWQPDSCLHPDIGVHTPLHIDLYDRWQGRAVAGCVYHVSHPGGRNHTTRPVNELEAEGRRAARFHLGHSPAVYELLDSPPRPEHPLTLDLRQP